MLRINQCKLPVNHSREQLEEKIKKLLRCKETPVYTIQRRSVDARKKPELYFNYIIDISMPNETAVYRRCDQKQVSLLPEEEYVFPVSEYHGKERPVIIGAGPAGLFCAYMLAEAGFRPIVLERGKCVEERTKDVNTFWETGILNPSSNVQFGEGGAGTFSDGKLNTLVKDKYGRNRKTLSIFVKEGAPAEILYDHKPHIGTDILCHVIRNMRERICALGGEIRFESQVTRLLCADGKCTGVLINEKEELASSYVVLAPGHSARDTFLMLYEKGVPMEAKPFAVGLRVEHLQNKINRSQYGREDAGVLGSAPYKLTAQAEGRGVYSFCMCPGGYVVNASSEQGRLAVNGMSYSGRNGKNANSAIIVSVGPKDFANDHPLAGIAFQRSLEEKAFQIGSGKVPVSRYGRFLNQVLLHNPDLKDVCRPVSSDLYTCETETVSEKVVCEEGHSFDDFADSELFPCIKGKWCYAPVEEIMPNALNRAFVIGMHDFARSIHGFDDDDVLLSGIESRTSSPVRILRDEHLEAELKGLFPCGEGAGYAGGITSAAMDGIKVAEEIARRIADGEQRQTAQTNDSYEVFADEKCHS